jgi:hypothetical protein
MVVYAGRPRSAVPEDFHNLKLQLGQLACGMPCSTNYIYMTIIIVKTMQLLSSDVTSSSKTPPGIIEKLPEKGALEMKKSR